MNQKEIEVLRTVVERGFGLADMNTIDRLISEDVVEHQFGRLNGRDELKKSILAIANGFSDRQYELVRFSTDGDVVWGHFKFTATHSGVFFGHQPTNRKVSIDVMDIAKISNGQIVEHWGVPDRFALLVQIGAILK
ncbi:ester cyclase [Chryseolinea soli]|uniref:Ester cyclase n=1 Tax=Chryseolinea soli TaxID=2321403 RepID=A0A385SIF2_9BACT|nr:ester cyclase [Chryseolinea soli]AYB31009.1 hypothetical protein D4L85_10650 [Chryseolinea soli]